MKQLRLELQTYTYIEKKKTCSNSILFTCVKRSTLAPHNKINLLILLRTRKKLKRPHRHELLKHIIIFIFKIFFI